MRNEQDGSESRKRQWCWGEPAQTENTRPPVSLAVADDQGASARPGMPSGDRKGSTSWFLPCVLGSGLKISPGHFVSTKSRPYISKSWRRDAMGISSVGDRKRREIYTERYGFADSRHRESVDAIKAPRRCAVRRFTRDNARNTTLYVQGES